MILCANPRAQYVSHKKEIDAAIASVLEDGRYVQGDAVNNFEKEFSSYIGASHAIGVGSGTEALHVALKACGIGAGDEVITVSHTAVATVAAIELAGASPVLVDIEPTYYTLNLSELKKAISPKTKAIVAVHIYGQPCDMRPILEIAKQHGLRVIEDCAQATGATWQDRRLGSIGDIGCFSFYPTKNLGAIGDGGMVVTNDAKLAQNVRLLREYGWEERYVSKISGWNSRLDELQAAVLRVKLRHLDADNAKRRALAERYNAALRALGVETPAAREDASHVYHLYVIRSAQRDELQTFLKSKGVHTLVHYPVPVHLQPAYRNRIRTIGELKQTEHAATTILSLPLYPELTNGDVETVIDAIKIFASETGVRAAASSAR